MKTPAPPSPGISVELVAAASNVGFRVTLGVRGNSPELGVFINAETSADQPLLLAAISPSADPFVANGCVWALDGAQACIPFVFSRATYNVLHEGELGADAGTVLYQGHAYRIQAQWDGFRPVAVAVKVPR
jgi:hypothetical protein